ncbi:MAG: TonB-dependent receptor [Sulfuritalea sp.]|nr:TonB-dependent receptor [Sulfuritalea sp.]
MHVLLALLAAPAIAQEVSEHDYFGDLPVVLSVTRLAQPLNEVPGAVTVIDAETIRRSGAREVAELLRLVPGFLVTRRNGGSTVAAYHAALDSYGARMQVYVDGRSVYSSYYLGDTHRGLAAVELADVQRIEVLRGSNSAAFGSNAFLGVVNIITRAAADTHGVSASITRGDRGIDDNFLRLGWGSEAADMRLTASRRATSGYESVYDDSRRSQLQFRGDFRVSSADEVSVNVGVAKESFGEGVPPVACTLRGMPGTCDQNKERTDSWRNGFARFNWSRTLSETSMLKVAGGLDQELYQSRFLAEQFSTLPLPFPPIPYSNSVPFDLGGRALRQNLEFQRTDVWRSDLRSVVGAEVLREEVRSASLFSSDASISARQLRLFGGIEWKPAADWVVNTGGMWEKHSMAGSTFAPRLAVNYHVLPEHTLRAISTQSFRMPSIYMFRGLANLQVTSTLLGPPFTVSQSAWSYAAATGRVRPESVIANEIGYLGELRRFGLKMDVRAFDERINHRHWVDSADMINMPGPRIHGVEYQFDWRPFATTRIVFAEAQLREEAGRDGVAEHFEAPHRTGSVTLYQKLPGGFDLSLITHYATPYQWADQVLDGMRQLDARLAYAFRVGATRGELAVTVQSLGGNHMEYLRTQLFGRRAFASLRLDF